MTLTVIALALVLIFTYHYILDYLTRWLEDDSNGVGRLEIFSSFGESFMRSPLFGLGPGTHANGGSIEFHNTYLEVLVATGVVGFVFFVVYTVRCIKKMWKADWTTIPIIVSLYAYSLAGFAMRRLAYWGVLILTMSVVNGILRESRAYDAEELN